MPASEVASLVSSLAPYFCSRTLVNGEVLIQAGESVEELLLVEEVCVWLARQLCTNDAAAGRGGACAWLLIGWVCATKFWGERVWRSYCWCAQMNC